VDRGLARLVPPLEGPKPKPEDAPGEESLLAQVGVQALRRMSVEYLAPLDAIFISTRLVFPILRVTIKVPAFTHDSCVSGLYS
jgi:hypothetical protein